MVKTRSKVAICQIRKICQPTMRSARSVRQGDGTKHLPRVGAVDAGRLIEFIRDRLQCRQQDDCHERRVAPTFVATTAMRAGQTSRSQPISVPVTREIRSAIWPNGLSKPNRKAMPVTATGIAQGMRLTGRAKCRMRDERFAVWRWPVRESARRRSRQSCKEEGEEHGVARDRALEELLVVVEADAAHRAPTWDSIGAG